MTGEKVDFEKARVAADQGPVTEGATRKYQASTIEFPNFDLDAAADVAKRVYGRSGLGACQLDELAAESNTTMSGTFRLKNSASKQFGFIEKDGASSVRLTDLGSRLVSRDTEAEAKATAFLSVGLYSQIYEKYRGKLLPPTKALEREMIGLGVTQAQAEKARQIFQRSARQAGFFNSGEDRLVRPRTSAGAAVQENTETLDQRAADIPPTVIDRRKGNGGSDGPPPPRGSDASFEDILLSKFPAFDPAWPDDLKKAWFADFKELMAMAPKKQGAQ